MRSRGTLVRARNEAINLHSKSMKINKEDLRLEPSPHCELIQHVYLGPEKVAHLNFTSSTGSIRFSHDDSFVRLGAGSEEEIRDRGIEKILERLNK
jgi:glycerol-3-phosphate cytidylyltransferase-like family protein